MLKQRHISFASSDIPCVTDGIEYAYQFSYGTFYFVWHN